MNTIIKQWVSLVITLTVVLGCYMPPPYKRAPENLRQTKIDSLTEFTIALNEKDYERAVNMLVEGDKVSICSVGDVIPEDMKQKLDKLHLTTLVNDRRVHMVNGKISGIYDNLEVLELGPEISETSTPKPAPYRLAELPREPFYSQEKLEVKIALNKFIQAINQKKWKNAMNMIEKSDRDLFFSYRGKMRRDIPERFNQIDMHHWEFVQLENGKLQGLYHLIPDGKTRGEIIITDFIRLIKADQWDEALGMLSRYERNYLCDNQGKIKPHYQIILKTLTPEEWEKFNIHEQRISGVLDWMGLGTYGKYGKYGQKGENQ